MFFKHDTRVVSFLHNIHNHLKADYDFLLVIVGDTGSGKSMFALQLLEAWYELVLKKSFDEKRISQVNTSFVSWVEEFQKLGEFDMNIYDEGSTSLDSKDAMSRLSKDLTKLFNVFRAKRFFSVIILPSFFNLNKYFREQRIRGLVHVHKRGRYRLFSKVGIDYLNALNERRLVKNMFVARPIHSSVFPDYRGVLRSLYDKKKMSSVDGVLEEVILSVQKSVEKAPLLYDLHSKDVLKLRKKKDSYRAISERLGINHMAVKRIVSELIDKKLL